jgi:hypothetical protein
VQALNAAETFIYSFIVEFRVFDGKKALTQADLVILPAEKTTPIGE